LRHKGKTRIEEMKGGGLIDKERRLLEQDTKAFAWMWRVGIEDCMDERGVNMCDQAHQGSGS
jgi:hypothetical protein